MHTSFITPLLLAAALIAPVGAAWAADEKPGEKPVNEQVIVPEVERRKVKVPKIPSNDFELGLFTGTYSTQNFGTNPVHGVRLGYHITEDFFVEGVYGRTKVSDETFRLVLPGGVFPQREANLNYYNLSAGINVLPGEIFFWRDTAKVSALYIIGGVGNTKFFDQSKQTLNFGVGARLFFTDWAAMQIDVRDHIFSIDLLGKRESTQNLELTIGATFFF